MSNQLAPTIEYNREAWNSVLDERLPEGAPDKMPLERQRGSELGSKTYIELAHRSPGLGRKWHFFCADIRDRVSFLLNHYRLMLPDVGPLEPADQRNPKVLVSRGFEQVAVGTVELHAEAFLIYTNIGKHGNVFVREVLVGIDPMAGAIIATPKLQMQRSRHKRVEARVEEVTDEDVIVNFDDVSIGWYSVSVPRGQFVDTPPVGSLVPLDISFESDRGIVEFGVPAGAKPKPVFAGRSEGTSRRALPPEPDDYDDPEQLRTYESELRKRFRFLK